MEKTSIISFLLMLIINQLHQCRCDEDNLVFVIAVHRHGARTPLAIYPTDPYQEDPYWPQGLGQLTDAGKRQAYELGQWLRQRYDGFLPNKYNVEDIYVRSTDVDRALMSAAANLAGLYPPLENETLYPSLPWQPLPIHSQLAKDDIALRAQVPCPRYDELRVQLANSPYFKKLDQTLSTLYSYLTKHTGNNVTQIYQVNSIFDTLFIEEENGLTLPEWSHRVYPHRMRHIVDVFFTIEAATEDLARIKVGPLFNEFVTHLKQAAYKDSIGERYIKMALYSAHDNTLSNILSAMKAFNKRQPPYSSAVLIELRRNQSNYYLNVLYKNSTKTPPLEMNIGGCDFDCDLNKFVDIVKPILITEDNWKALCLETEARESVDTLMVLTVILACLGIVAVFAALYGCIKYFLISAKCLSFKSERTYDIDGGIKK